MNWEYKSIQDKSNGYEDVIDKLKKYNRDDYLNASIEDQKTMIEDIFNIYRGINILPIQYYSKPGVNNEIVKCINKEVSFDGNVLNLKFNQGSSLCRFMFPNLTKVYCLGGENNSIYERFESDHKLKKAIRFCLLHKKSRSPVTPSGLKDGLEMIEHGIATNFKPMNAKALYERYTPKGGIIYDFACGFGGRMLGALSSKNNYKYYGVEPNTETYKNLIELGYRIEEVKRRSNLFKIKCIGSESIDVKNKESVDFAFSSPPYFSLEQYCNEDTQCYIKYPALDEWFKGYVEPTIKNIYSLLKPESYYAVNISDFKLGKKTVNFVDEWVNISKEAGFEYVEQIHMKLQTRRGDGHGENKRNKKEGIFVFKKVAI